MEYQGDRYEPMLCDDPRLLSIGDCATTTPPSPESNASNKYSEDTGLCPHVNCVLDCASLYVQSNASASEISDAAVATFETHLLDVQRVMYASMVKRYETQHGVQAALEGVKELIRDLRPKTRGTVIGKVLELRARK